MAVEVQGAGGDAARATPAVTWPAAGKWPPARWGWARQAACRGGPPDAAAASLLFDAAAHGDALRGHAAHHGVQVGALLRLPGQLGVARVVVYLQGRGIVSGKEH